MKALLFDLDDTLYREMDFVEGGFRAVAGYLCRRASRNVEEIFDRMMAILERDGRGRVFDVILRETGCHSHSMVQTLVFVYRSYEPSIRLARGATDLLMQCRDLGIKTGLVTDGMGSIQHRKIAALGLEKLVDVIVCTDELGRENWKPSPVPFSVALELLDVLPGDATYVGDNVTKDFAGPNSLGMATIMLGDDNARARASELLKTFRPDFSVESLEEIMPTLKGNDLA